MLKLLKRTMSEQSKVAAAWNQFIVRQLSDLNAKPSQQNDLQNNPYYSKYADKLKKVTTDGQSKSQTDQLTSEEKQVREKIEHLNQKLEQQEETNQPKVHNANVDAHKTSGVDGTRRTPSYVKARKLNDIVKVELLVNHSKEEIKDIWCQYFRNKQDCLFACIDKSTYDVQKSNADRYPLFVFPLPVNDETDEKHQTSPDTIETPKYQIVLAQFHQDQVYFTPLIMYQQYGENAPPCLTVNHFAELAPSKDIVLMEGEFDKQIFSASEAQCLVNQLQIFYATLDAKRIELLHRFNFEPTTFDYQEIIKEFENLSLKPSTK